VIGSQLATFFVMQLSTDLVIDLLNESDKLVLDGNFKLLDELHHFTSGMKALMTDYAYNGIDTLRQSCGGAGFTLASGIADNWMDIAPYSTFEGVNVVMA